MKEFTDAAEEAIGAQMKGAIPVISIQTLVIKQYSIGFVVKALGGKYTTRGSANG